MEQVAEQQRERVYVAGDQAEYTGESEVLYGGLFYMVLMLEGQHKGKVRHVVRAPKINAMNTHADAYPSKQGIRDERNSASDAGIGSGHRTLTTQVQQSAERAV